MKKKEKFKQIKIFEQVGKNTRKLAEELFSISKLDEILSKIFNGG